MLALAKILFHLALGLWIGAIVFVSFVVAPTVFRVLPSETAGVVMGQIFPLYSELSMVVGIVALGSSLLSVDEAKAIVTTWISTAMREPRYIRRLTKISALERRS